MISVDFFFRKKPELVYAGAMELTKPKIKFFLFREQDLKNGWMSACKYTSEFYWKSDDVADIWFYVMIIAQLRK